MCFDKDKECLRVCVYVGGEEVVCHGLVMHMLKVEIHTATVNLSYFFYLYFIFHFKGCKLNPLKEHVTHTKCMQLWKSLKDVMSPSLLLKFAPIFNLA